MDDLPSSLVLEILSRLTDSADLARCRPVSKTLNALSCEVKSVNLLCTLARYQKSRSPDTKNLTTPFKTIFKKLILNSRSIDSVSIGVEKSLTGISYDDVEGESDDLYLTDVGFVKEWLPSVCGDLRCLSISDFWIQSCWRRSDILALISSCCHSLLKLEVKNAWLSVDGPSPMPTLTNLTLEFVRLDDEDLNKVNECFPSLQVLNLVGVGGLKEPKIQLLHLKTCRWTVSNAPLSLTIFAPNLVKLKLKCVRPKSLVLETPLLSDLHLSLEKANEFRAQDFHNLRNLQLESWSLCSLIGTFPSGRTVSRTVKKLMVDSLKRAEPAEIISMEALFDLFPNVSTLTLGPAAWSDLETCFRTEGLEGRIGMKEVTKIIAHLLVQDFDVTLSFIFSILDKCTNLSDMVLRINRKVDFKVASNLISRCATDHPRVRWRWAMWKEGTNDTWVSDGI